ncbi:MAG TPA: hypothetical protein VND91_12070, partial [Candidatus Saccharimonadia bacterium]|nr:hypothetical protein [Candidatus Saccharimonadia bacterium]
MKINPLRRKPGWESRDAAERARAVAHATLAELGERLPELVRNDASPDVRRAALRRLDDLSLLADRMRHDEHDSVRDAARLRYKELLVETGRAAAERERVLRVEDDQDVLAHVAAHATEAALRRVALERITRAGLLVERCQRDPDPAIRLWLLSRSESPAPLERVAESVRKSDKLLARVARERLESLKLAAGDPATLRARALSICDQLDAFRRERPADPGPRREALAAEWSLLRDRLDAAMVRRVEGYFAALEPRQAAGPVGDASDETGVPAEPALETEGVATTEPEADPAEAAAAALASERAEAEQREIAQERERRDAERAHERERRDAERDAQRVALVDALAALELAIADGKLAAARPAHALLASARAASGSVPRDLAGRITSVDTAYDKLVRWQHCSNNKVRSRLCSEADALVASGLHPDAVAAKVKDLQLAWQRLDESEAIATDAPDSGIAKRFRGACHRALAPTRKYFEKRRELRGQKQEEVVGLGAEVERGLESDPRSAPALRRRVVAALQRLDELDPRARAAQGRKLRALLARFDELNSAVAGEAEVEKRKLIANLRREIARAPLPDALEKARHAQDEWKRIGPAAR